MGWRYGAFIENRSLAYSYFHKFFFTYFYTAVSKPGKPLILNMPNHIHPIITKAVIYHSMAYGAKTNNIGVNIQTDPEMILSM